MRVELPWRFAVWTAVAPLPLFAVARDGYVSRIEGGLLHFAAFNAGVIALVKPLRLDHDTTPYYLPAATVCPAILAALLLTGREVV